MFLSNFDNINITLETGAKCKLRVDKMFKGHIVRKDLVALDGGGLFCPTMKQKKLLFTNVFFIISCLRQSYI